MDWPTAPIAMTMGDPAGVGPQITHLAWEALKQSHQPFFVIAPPDALAPFGEIAVIDTPTEARDVFSERLPVLPIDGIMDGVTPGQPNASTAPAILASIETATSLTRSGAASAIVTNPISKALLYEAGFSHPGHTEYLAALCCENGAEQQTPVMMLVGGGLRVALATIHLPLREAIAAITTDSLSATARIVDRALRRDFGVLTPRIAFSGLNPHAGEAGSLGREELEIINPTADSLRASGIVISHARPADSVFAEALAGAYDAVIAMTHDQGLIPVKTLDFWGGVNVTLGLPIIRTSPDHGTAYDAAASGTGRADSLIAAVRLAGDLARNRAAHG